MGVAASVKHIQLCGRGSHDGWAATGGGVRYKSSLLVIQLRSCKRIINLILEFHMLLIMLILCLQDLFSKEKFGKIYFILIKM